MRASTCDQADGYMGKWLTQEERDQFEAHLAHCADCRQFIEETLRLENLLNRAHAGSLAVPAGLIDRIEHRLRQARRRRARAWAIGLAAAGVLTCAITSWLLFPPVPEARSV